MPNLDRKPIPAQVVATRKALQHAQAELHVVGEELAQARREVSLTKREQVRASVPSFSGSGASQPANLPLQTYLSGPDLSKAWTGPRPYATKGPAPRTMLVRVCIAYLCGQDPGLF